MIPDAYMPSPDQMAQLVEIVAVYSSAGIGFGLLGWLLGYLFWFVIDLVRGFVL